MRKALIPILTALTALTALAVAVALLVGAGAMACGGAFLDWVTITPPRIVPPNQTDSLATFTGIQTSDGRLIALGGVAMIVCAVLLARLG